MGVQGVGIATMISYSFNFVMITAMCMSIKELKKSFFLITKESMSEGITEYLKIGIPNAAMLCLEWGGLEVLALIASAISVDATGAQIIALIFFIVILMIPFGGQVGSTVCVGKAMGEGDSKKARTFIKIASVFMLIVDFFSAFVIVIYKDWILRLFTSSEILLKYVSSTVETMAILLIFNGAQLILAGALRGLGMQSIAAFIVICSQYIIALPASYIFAITLEQGIKGIWQALILGNIA
jgi:MATE family multidrug resistance protein